ncbi:hypothetical protein STEG23_028986 [Scotinomys teguina]
MEAVSMLELDMPTQTVASMGPLSGQAKAPLSMTGASSPAQRALSEVLEVCQQIFMKVSPCTPGSSGTCSVRPEGAAFLKSSSLQERRPSLDGSVFVNCLLILQHQEEQAQSVEVNTSALPLL